MKYHIGKYTLGFFAATLLFSIIMWVGEVEIYGILVGLVALLTEVIMSQYRVC